MGYKIEFCYKVPTKPQNLDPAQYLAIDLGLNNVATMVDTATGAAVILDGKRIKSINRWYNKENARLQSIKDKQGITGITKRQARLLKKRDCQITEAMNRYVTWIADYVLQHRIGTVVLPRWDGIKDKIRAGSVACGEEHSVDWMLVSLLRQTDLKIRRAWGDSNPRRPG